MWIADRVAALTGDSRRRRGAGVCALLAFAGAFAGAGPAVATAAPAFSLTSTKTPVAYQIGDKNVGYRVVATNVGDAAQAGPTTLEFVLPAGLTVRKASAGTAACVVTGPQVRCTESGSVAPNQTIAVDTELSVGDAAVDGATASVVVSGGVAPTVSLQDPFAIRPRLLFGIQNFVASTFDSTGAEDTVAKAGGHPFEATASFTVNNYLNALRLRAPVEAVKDTITDLPPGFIGNPQLAAKCKVSQLVGNKCPIASQVGVIRVDLTDNFVTTPPTPTPFGVYNMVPDGGNTAQFGASVGNLGIVHLVASVRSDSDFGVRLIVRNIPANPAPQSVELTLWGTPGDPTHNADRFDCTSGFCVGGAPAATPPVPFLSNPHHCEEVPPVTTMTMNSWQNPGVYKAFEYRAPPLVGCDRLTFEPEVEIQPTTNLPDAPTGLNVDMRFPTEDNAEGLTPPPLKKAVVTLPEGMTINPSGAGGLDACTDGQLNLKTKDPVTCPNAARVGEVTATSPVLEETLSGGVYIRSQNSRDPESGEMFRIALVLENEERGLSIRLPGQIRVNKATGRIETTFDNNPQVPVSNINLQFKDGPRAPLATPAQCGPKTIDTVLTSWGGQTKSLQSTFNVACLPGLGSFGPGFRAGTVDPTAAGSAPFNLLLTRADGQDVLDGLKLEMPEGLLANLKGNVGTQIGTVTIDAGPGSQPFRFPGKVYLEGPYGEAPFSLKVVVPAKAGPFDLGEVVVRQKILVDPTDAHVTVVSDPVPTIVEGVPVRLRNLSVDIDKPGFMINPTSCDEKRIAATAHSLGGKSANVASRFQVGGCAALPLKPKMNLTLTGAKETGYHKHPGLSADVTQVPGESGLKQVKVSLPLSLALDPDNAKALCKPEQAAAKACPEGSIIGDATAVSPVLNRPLTGHVYFVEGLRTSETGRVIKTLPKLWVALRGEVSLDVWADSDVDAKGRLVNTFAKVPDAPISSFKLNVTGGKNGILKVSGEQGNSLCKGVQVADAQFDGQNGKRLLTKTHMTTPCGFRAVSSSLGSRKARVTVSGLGKGKLAVSGGGIRKTSRTIKKSDVATINASLTAAGKRAYRAHKPVKVKLSFTPAGGKAKTVTATVKRAKAKKQGNAAR